MKTSSAQAVGKVDAERVVSRGLMNAFHRKGDRTAPWGVERVRSLEAKPTPSWTEIVREGRKLAMIWMRIGGKLRSMRFARMAGCQAESKADLMSMERPKTRLGRLERSVSM